MSKIMFITFSFFLSFSLHSFFFRMKEGRTALYLAYKKGHDTTVSLLIKDNPNIDMEDKEVFFHSPFCCQDYFFPSTHRPFFRFNQVFEHSSSLRL